jgi:hypothetical protein
MHVGLLSFNHLPHKFISDIISGQRKFSFVIFEHKATHVSNFFITLYNTSKSPINKQIHYYPQLSQVLLCYMLAELSESDASVISASRKQVSLVDSSTGDRSCLQRIDK